MSCLDQPSRCRIRAPALTLCPPMLGMASQSDNMLHTRGGVIGGSVKTLKSTLLSFASSKDHFHLLHSLGVQNAPAESSAQTIYILDSSFNPPTRAHLRIAASALREDKKSEGPKRILLLLATQNADKAPKPAAFEQRLQMMSAFAQDLQGFIGTDDEYTAGDGKALPSIDIAVVKFPYFHDKAKAIADSGTYLSDATQVHLVGFDTLIRILDPKYYPPAHTLAPLEPFLGTHRLRVSYRTDAEWGNEEAQRQYLTDLREGKRENVGGRKEWAENIELVYGRNAKDDVVSSTKARDACENGDLEALARLVTDDVLKYIVAEKLYQKAK
jgi:nicotinamide-nucleotide adenylyltransferase